MKFVGERTAEALFAFHGIGLAVRDFAAGMGAWTGPKGGTAVLSK